MNLPWHSSPTMRPAFLLICCLAATTTGPFAQVKLGSVFGDHMVLPEGVSVSIWGSGCPGGDTLKLSIAGQSVVTRSDWQGNWEVKLQPMKAGGPYQMNIQIGGSGRLVISSAANDHGGAEINDVMIGKVVLMQAVTPQSASALPAPAAAGAHPYAEVRIFRSGELVKTAYDSPSSARWVYVVQDVLLPPTAAYFQAGRDLHEKLHVPIGVIVTAKAPACSPASDCTASPPVSPSQ